MGSNDPKINKLTIQNNSKNGGGENMKRKTHEDYVNELKIKNPNVEVIDKYINAKTPILHRCLIHDVIWNTSPDGVLQGAGCENCRRDKLHKHHQKTHAQYVQDLSIKNPNIKVIDEYIDCHTPILHHCEVHDVDWRIAPNNALQGGGCSMCKSNKIAKALKKTHNEYVQELADAKPYISVVDLYVDANTQIQHYCHKHNRLWMASPNVVLHGCGCPDCRLEKDWNGLARTHERYISLVAEINPNIQVVGQYINASTPINHYCTKHKITWAALPDNILRGHGCVECGKEKTGFKNTKTHEQYILDVHNVNEHILVLEKYIDCATAILHQCTICGTIWKPIPNNVLSRKGCPGCNQSYGEQMVSNWLVFNDIKYVPQYKFIDCIDKRPLPFDFYISELNICIEYQGQQHYQPVNFGGISDEDAYNNFLTIQCHDEIKKNYCDSNGIKLIYVPYWENVDEFLNKNLLI